MNYDEIVKSAYSWISLKKVAWFIAFFWVALPFILLMPMVFEKRLVYSHATLPIAMILYNILYFTLIVGIIMLIHYCLEGKKQESCKLSAKRIFDIILLVFVELFYILVWGSNVSLRKVQLLLIIASSLAFYCYNFFGFEYVLYALALSLISYAILCFYNFVRLFFTTSVFSNRCDLGIRETIKESWALTHGKSRETLNGILLGSFFSVIIFLFIYIALGAVATMVFNYFFINSLALSFGFKVAAAFALGPALLAYHFSMAEVFSQLNSHKEYSKKINKVLAHRLLHPQTKPLEKEKTISKRSKPRATSKKVIRKNKTRKIK